MDVSALRRREATIAAGIWLTFGVGGLGMAYVLLTWQRPHRTELAVLFALACAIGVVVSLLPRERIVRSSLREPFFLTWTLLAFLMLLLATLADGGTSSPVVLIFFLPIVFSAMSYPLGSVVAVGLLSVLSYLTLAFTAGGYSPAYQAAFAAALACTAAISAWQTQNNNRQHRALATASPSDPLTGGLNRRGFEERAAAAIGAMTHSDPANLQAALLDQIDASVIVSDVSGTVISWNSGAEALYGWTREEALGRSARDLVVPEDTQAAERLVGELRRDGRWDGELLVRRKDRSTFTAYVRNRLILDENSEPSAIVGVAVDISPRVAAETELLQSRDYAQAVTECMGEGLFTLDVDGRVTYINRTAETLLGWPEGQLNGQPIGEVIARSGELTRPFEESAMARALSQEEPVRVEDDLFMARNGRTLPVAYTAAPFRTDDGLQGCVVIFQDVSERKRREEEQRRDVATLACINRVEAAIVEERFVLYAQPIIDLRTGETVQHELLLRMREPDGGIVSPAEFLHVAEQYALIGEIDWWVIKQATQLAGLGCRVQLNISARSIGDPDVLEHIERCIEQCAVPPGVLVFEITETAIVEDQEAARAFAQRLHALGCKIALDDFGTGYGGLTYLKQIPVDYLKLDAEFVHDLASSSASRHVVQAVVALARDFRVQTIAEGVESAEALDILSRFGVDFIQGFHLAHPEPFTERPGDRSPPVRIRPREVRRLEPRRSVARRPTPMARRSV
ncbi:MAG: hypothetical protein JWL67_984 [Solirubrobacterales bacterium]|nr:hypothetical protein [Solirubrobacterales bacterium]